MLKLFTGFLIYLSIASCNSKPNTNSMNTIAHTDQISLEVELPPSGIIKGKPFPVRVSIRNKSPQALLVNKRLEVGYRDSDSRELFLEIRDAQSNALLSKPLEDYQNDPAAAEDYGWLQPGESLETEFDLFEWYEIKTDAEESRKCLLTLFYQADESREELPEKVIKGIFASPDISLTIDN